MSCQRRGQIIAVSWSIVLMLSCQSVFAQGNSPNNPMDIVCLTNRPVILEGDSTRLQVWVTTEEGQSLSQPVSFVWQVSEGAVQGTGPEVQWDLSTVMVGPTEEQKKMTATVKAVVTGLGEASCGVEVFVGKKEKAMPPGPISDTRGLRSARRFLLPAKDKKEVRGFGLYSYLLFAGKPGLAEEKSRYLKILEACFRAMESVEDHIEHHRDPSELNAMHIPVKTMPKSSAIPGEWAANVLAVYDYTAAQALLDKLQKTYERGPYLVSVLDNPLSNQTGSVQTHLLQDFTGMVPDLVSQVVDLFTYRAAQQRAWTDESLRSFRLNMRNLVAVAGKVVPEVASAMVVLVQDNQPR